MNASVRQTGVVIAGALALAGLGIWAAGARPPMWLCLGLPPVALSAMAWGLWGRGARGVEVERRRLEDQAWEVVRTLGGISAGHGRSTAELAASLERATEAVRALSVSAAEGRGWREMIEAVGEPLVATDAAGRVVLVSRAAERALGVRFEGRPRAIDELIAQHDVLALHQTASEGKSAWAQVRLVRGDEARVYDTMASPLGPGQAAGNGGGRGAGGGVVLAFRDVTDLATAIQARTDFVANASHELRTPLAAMRAAYDTLRLALDDPRMRDRALELAGSNLKRLEEMTRDLLDLSRLESPDAQVRLEVVDMKELVEDVASAFEAARQPRRLGLSIEIAPGARRVETDPRLVQEVMRNLIDNACRFAHEGTTIRVVGEAVPESAGVAGRAMLRLRVIDLGTGIPLDQQGRIFERFYQVDPARSGKGRGTGLGLAIVKHAVRALGGSVDVESVWGQGTTMIVELPGAVVSSGGEVVGRVEG